MKRQELNYNKEADSIIVKFQNYTSDFKFQQGKKKCLLVMFYLDCTLEHRKTFIM